MISVIFVLFHCIGHDPQFFGNFIVRHPAEAQRVDLFAGRRQLFKYRQQRPEYLGLLYVVKKCFVVFL